MTTAPEAPGVKAADVQLATFSVGELLFGLDIAQVKEINRRLDVTRVPHAPDAVLGVINLRGDVVTVVDLRCILGLGTSELSDQSRNVIVSHHGELVGLCVDRIADILNVDSSQIDHTPSNVSEIDSRRFSGVVPLESGIVAVLNLTSVLDLT